LSASDGGHSGTSPKFIKINLSRPAPSRDNISRICLRASWKCLFSRKARFEKSCIFLPGHNALRHIRHTHKDFHGRHPIFSRP